MLQGRGEGQGVEGWSGLPHSTGGQSGERAGVKKVQAERPLRRSSEQVQGDGKPPCGRESWRNAIAALYSSAELSCILSNAVHGCLCLLSCTTRLYYARRLHHAPGARGPRTKDATCAHDDGKLVMTDVRTFVARWPRSREPAGLSISGLGVSLTRSRGSSAAAHASRTVCAHQHQTGQAEFSFRIQLYFTLRWCEAGFDGPHVAFDGPQRHSLRRHCADRSHV